MERLKSICAGELMQTVWRWLAALFFIGAGINHFVMPDFYERIVPPGFPGPKLLVIVSGLAETAGGLGLLIPPLRRVAGWGLIAMLIAIFPANIYMALHPERFGMSSWILWARLPLQVVFIVWVWWVARCRSQNTRRLLSADQ